MKDIKHIIFSRMYSTGAVGRKLMAGMLAFVMLFVGFSTDGLQTAAASELTADAVISLAYVRQVTIDTPNCVVAITGASAEPYQVPIAVNADCTVILDQINNQQDITISDTANVKLCVKGSNTVRDIICNGGDLHTLTITGISEDAKLCANRIACASGTAGCTAAKLYLGSCQIICEELGCGSNGTDASYYGGSATMANATPGTHASPHITVQSAALQVNGNMACGGNGASSSGTWSATASDGGSAGEVLIDHSSVSVGGNLAIGGKGGDGTLGSSYYNHTAGVTKSSAPVTIQNHSSVTVAGNVSTQQALPYSSESGTQKGLNGVTVTVTDSELTAKDIASGGEGHRYVCSETYAGSGARYNIYGTAGGSGGTILANNARISCETAVCGANAGEYQVYEISMYGTYSGDHECNRHPLDGNGGVIRAQQSTFQIASYAGAKGSRWNNYANPSVYGDHIFIGGSVTGTVYGAVITTDATSLAEGSFLASGEVRNSDEQSCAACVLRTADSMQGQTVTIDTQNFQTTTQLAADGSLHTYLAIGDNRVRLTGTSIYSGSIRVRRSAALNDFQLTAYGDLLMAQDDAVIRADSYTHMGEDRTYDGDYTVSGIGADHSIRVISGTHTLIFGRTDIDTLEIGGNSEVTARLEDLVHIRHLIVGPDASLTVIRSDAAAAEGTWSELFSADTVEQQGTMRESSGTRLFPVTFFFDHPADYTLTLQKECTQKSEETAAAITQTVSADMTERTLLLAEGYYALTLQTAVPQIQYRARICITQAQQIHTDDLLLYADASEAVTIDGDAVSRSGASIETQADIYLYVPEDQSPAPILVNRQTANLQLQDLPRSTQLWLPENFSGTVRDAVTQQPIGVVSVHTGLPEHEVTLQLGDESYTILTNENGDFTFLTETSDPSFSVVIDGVTYYPSKPGELDYSSTGNHLFMEDLTTEPVSDTEGTDEPDDPSQGREGESGSADPSQNESEEGSQTQGGGTAEGGESSSGGGSYSGGGSSSGGSSSSGNASSSGGSSSSGGGSYSGGGSSSGSSTSHSDSDASGKADAGAKDQTSGTAGAKKENATIAEKSHTTSGGALTLPRIRLQQVTPAAIRLIDIAAVSKKIAYTSKTVKLRIHREADTDYYYRLVPDADRGTSTAKNRCTKTKWKKMKSDTITIRGRSGQYLSGHIVYKAVRDGSVTKKKTTQFVIDRTRPTVSGVKNMKIYRGSRKVKVSDNSSRLTICLNHKKVKSSFTVTKRGVYKLTAEDAAGNRKTVIFAVW